MLGGRLEYFSIIYRSLTSFLKTCMKQLGDKMEGIHVERSRDRYIASDLLLYSFLFLWIFY